MGFGNRSLQWSLSSIDAAMRLSFEFTRCRVPSLNPLRSAGGTSRLCVSRSVYAADLCQEKKKRRERGVFRHATGCVKGRMEGRPCRYLQVHAVVGLSALDNLPLLVGGREREYREGTRHDAIGSRRKTRGTCLAKHGRLSAPPRAMPAEGLRGTRRLGLFQPHRGPKCLSSTAVFSPRVKGRICMPKRHSIIEDLKMG